MDGVAAVEEDRVRHRRVVVFAREPAARHHLRTEDAARRAEAATPRRYRPAIARLAVDRDGHALVRLVDANVDARASRVGGEKKGGNNRECDHQTTHGTPQPRCAASAMSIAKDAAACKALSRSRPLTIRFNAAHWSCKCRTRKLTCASMC